MSGDQLDMVVQKFVADMGNVTQSFGIGRAVGQVYAFLYFSAESMNLGNMQEALGISRGAASAAVRQLEQWGAVKKVWIKGDRKDYYVADEWLGKIVKNVVADVVGRKMTVCSALLDGLEHDIPEGNGNGEFVKGRIENLKRFHDKIESIWSSKFLQLLIK
ncbi:MAG: hypothetical protein KKF42_08865, partial [Actinobacteria bacterium]|nr:hypothetical protein [Actinomycetota bacterium]